MPCSGDGKIVLSDSALKKEAEAKGLPPAMPAVDLDLEKVTNHLWLYQLDIALAN